MLDRDYLVELFSEFGPVTLRRMFSGYGVSTDGVTFALAIRDGVFLRADPATIPRFEAEGMTPFSYDTRRRTVVVKSYWPIPARLYHDPVELAEWARAAQQAAVRAAAAKVSRVGVRTGPLAKGKPKRAPAKRSKRQATRD